MVRELRSGVWWLDLGGVNAYLVDDDGTLTLVDAGFPWHGDDVVDGVVEAGYTLADLDRVLVTHYDLNHVGGLDRLSGLDVPVYAGRADAPLVAGDRSPRPTSFKSATQRAMGLLAPSHCLEVRPVVDGDSVGSFTVYETPGHTDGHVAYVSETLETALLGDLVRESGGDLAASPWFISEDADRVRRSVRDLADRAPPFEVAAVGHGVPFERRGKERLDELAATL